ncbi:hypothetical protein NMY22_g2729 [Coprinellus aureogranulatus]|nr:hypothetical protein NMY22_g2729 [Coprinellus aureogranulatus]
MISLASVQLLISISAATLLWSFLRRFLRSRHLNNIPGPEPTHWFVGHLPEVFAPNAWDFHQSLAENYGRVSRLVGWFGAPVLYVYDPKALYHIFVKDQDIFEDDDANMGFRAAAFGPGLLGTSGAQHKKQRKMLNPVFSVAYIKKMIPTFYSVTSNLRDALLEKTANGPVEVDITQLMGKTALELISQCGLGKSFNSFADGDEDEYITAMKMLLPLASGSKRLLLIRALFMARVFKYNLGTSAFLHFIVSITPFRQLRLLQEKIDIMHKTSVEIFNLKQKAIAEGRDTEQLDFLSILMRENAKASEEDRLPDDQVIAQITTLVFAATDTTSNAVSRILWLLASKQDVQDKLRNEIREAKQRFGVEPGYEELMALPYLDAVIRETLRIYAPAPTIPREAHQDGILPLSKPIRTTDGKEITEIFVPEGTKIIVHLSATNTDPELWGLDSPRTRSVFKFDDLRRRPTCLYWLQVLGSEMSEFRVLVLGLTTLLLTMTTTFFCTEAVLFQIVDLFKFTRGSKEIYWNNVGVVTPSTDRDIKSRTASMPIVISRAD